MGFLYLGFDTQAMLGFLREFNDEILLKTIKNGQWELTKINKGKQSFKISGSLTLCVTKAFKPHLKDANIMRADFKKNIGDIYKC